MNPHSGAGAPAGASDQTPADTGDQPSGNPAVAPVLLQRTSGSGALDLHSHFLTPSYRSACINAGQHQPDGMPGLPRWSAQAALSAMNRIGIGAAVLSISSPGVFFGDVTEAVELARVVNDEAAELVAAHPDRFGSAASLPLPDVSAAVAEATRVYREHRVDAISLHTNYGGLYLGDPSMLPLFEVLDAHGAVVLLHPTSPPCWQQLSFGRPRPMVEFLLDTTRAVFNLALSGTLTRHQNITWVVPHTGGALSVMTDRVNLYAPAFAAPDDPEIDVAGELARLYYDVAGVPLPRALPALARLAQAGHIVYGSDYPFTPIEVVERSAEALITAELPLALADLLRTNAEQLFPRLAS